MYKYIKPGGWIQLVEYDLDFQCDDGTLTEIIFIAVYMSTISASLVQAGKDPQVARKLKGYAEDAGFVNVKEETLRTPISNWPKDKKLKERGRWVLAASETGVEAHAIALMTRAKDKKSQEEIKAFIDSVKMDQNTRRVHAYQYHRFVVGQKPAEAVQPAPRTR